MFLKNKKILFLGLVFLGLVFFGENTLAVNGDRFETGKKYVFCVCGNLGVVNERIYDIGSAKTLYENWHQQKASQNKPMSVANCSESDECKILRCEYYQRTGASLSDNVPSIRGCTEAWDENFGKTSDPYKIIEGDPFSRIFEAETLNVVFKCLNEDCNKNFQILNASLTDNKAEFRLKEDTPIGSYVAEVGLYDLSNVLYDANAVFVWVDAKPCKTVIPTTLDCSDPKNKEVCKTKCESAKHCIFDETICRAKTSADEPSSATPATSKKENVVLSKEQLLAKYADEYGGRPDGYTGPLPACAFSGTCRNVNDILTLIISFGKGLFMIIGSFALVMFIYGGFMVMISAGSDERVTKGKGIMLAAVIGLIIALSAYTMIDLLLDALGVVDDFRGVIN